MNIEKFKTRFNQLTNGTTLEVFSSYARDIGWSLDDMSLSDLNQLACIVDSTKERITDPDKYAFLLALDNLLFTVISSRRKRDDELAIVDYIEEKLPKAILQFLDKDEVVSLDDIWNAVTYSSGTDRLFDGKILAEDEFNSAIRNLEYCGYIASFGPKQWYSTALWKISKKENNAT